MTHRSGISAPRGFTLVEVMVTIAVLGVVMVAIMTSFIQTQDASRRVRQFVDLRQSARAGVQLIERDVRMAGSGWGRNPLNVYQSGVTSQWWAIAPGPGAGANDSLVLLGAWEAQTTLAQTMLTETAPLQVASVAGFATNDLCVVTDGTRAHMFQVTGVNTGTNTLSHASSSIFNPAGSPGTWNWPATGYAANVTLVYKMSRLAFYVDSVTFPRPVLIRREFGKAPSVVVYDVDRFQVWYRTQGALDSLTRTPAVSGSGIGLLAQVQPRIYTRMVAPNRPTYVDSLWADIQPRTF